MRFESLFEIPNQFSTIIESLQYMLGLMIVNEKLIIDANEILLEMSQQPKRHLFFKKNDEYIYIPLPEFWKINFKSIEESIIDCSQVDPKEEPIVDTFHCPYKIDHEMMNWINKIKKLSEKRHLVSKNFSKLNLLMKIVLKEYKKKIFNKLDCDHCVNRSRQIKIIGFPDFMIDRLFIGSLNDSSNEDAKIIEPHINYCNILINQTRNKDMKIEIINNIIDLYYKYKSIYSKNLLDGKNVNDIYLNFRRDLESVLIKKIPFLSFQNIDYEKWFKSIFLFQLEFNEIKKHDYTDKILFCKKLFFLIYELFDEDKRDGVGYIINNSKKFRIKINNDKLYQYHPILRGLYLTNEVF